MTSFEQRKAFVKLRPLPLENGSTRLTKARRKRSVWERCRAGWRVWNSGHGIWLNSSSLRLPCEWAENFVTYVGRTFYRSAWVSAVHVRTAGVLLSLRAMTPPSSSLQRDGSYYEKQHGWFWLPVNGLGCPFFMLNGLCGPFSRTALYPG